MEIPSFDPTLTPRPEVSPARRGRRASLSARSSLLLALFTLLASLGFTIWLWQLAREDIDRDVAGRFDARFAEIKGAVQIRMEAQKQVLLGARGLFRASDKVTRQEWRDYVESLQLAQTYPGMQGVGFTRYLKPEEVEAHVRAVRAEGFPDYALHPPGERPEYTAITFIEPFDWRNQRAFGFDMFAEPVRREAMAGARDSGNTAVTGKVVLVQETDQEVQAGFLMYLAVYRRGAPTETPAQRQAALMGYVYCPLRMNDLMAGILGPSLTDVALRIYDGTAVADAAFMYDSHGPHTTADAIATVTRGDGKASPAPLLQRRETILVQGHPWTLEVSAQPGFQADIPFQRPGVILQAGIIISALLFFVVWSQGTLRQRATALAQDMTGALRESREQFRAVAETAQDAIVSSDEEGRIVYFNRAAESMFGHAREEVLGQPMVLLIPERFQTAHEKGFRHFLATGKRQVSGTMELTARRRDGGEFPIELSVSRWSTETGRFVTAILRDVSERSEAAERIRRLNQELQHQVDQLAAVNQELESFSYSVSHDLRAPLRAINGFAGMLAEDYGGGLDEEGQRRLRIIRENSRKMSQLIDDLLAFSRLGRANLARSRVDMARLAREVVEEMGERGDCPGTDFALPDLPSAMGDKALLRQVWVNLLTNAVKFSRTRPEPRVEAGCERRDGELVYFVRDNGVGFDMAYASQLFGVFQRLHRADEFPGTGVGLAIVHRIITRHGGRVWAEGQVDRGACFYFALPLDPPPPPAEGEHHG